MLSRLLARIAPLSMPKPLTSSAIEWICRPKSPSEAPSRPHTVKNARPPTRPSAKSGSHRTLAVTPAHRQRTNIITGVATVKLFHAGRTDYVRHPTKVIRSHSSLNGANSSSFNGVSSVGTRVLSARFSRGTVACRVSTAIRETVRLCQWQSPLSASWRQRAYIQRNPAVAGFLCVKTPTPPSPRSHPQGS